MKTWVPLCDSVCLSQSPHLWSHTLIKMYTCISTCIHANWLPISALSLLHIYMQTWMSLCGIVCLFQSSHSSLACVHASVHVLISPWVSMSAPPNWNRGLTSKWRSNLQSEVPLPARGLTSDQMSYFQSPLIRGETYNWRWTSDWRWDLHLEVISPFQEDLSPPVGVT